ncbi:MAG: hypothetical protein LUI12_12205 [Clostridiales bacterium]|nr:hypothetical protein [Clostridiales bacterium]
MKKGFVGVLSLLAGVAVGAAGVGKVTGDRTQEVQELSDKHLGLFLMMNQWVKVKQEGKNLSSYFKKNGYSRIAVYGMSYAGETLVEELKNSGITIAYGIDQKADSIYADVEIVSADGDLEEVDAVVVTAITFFDEIEEKLSAKIECPILSLEDILYEM